MFPLKIEVPSFSGAASVEINAASTVVFIGANGAGKTRLGVFLDKHLSNNGIEVHRIAAHRSLVLNPNVVPPSYEIATKRLFYGHEKGDHNHKHGHRFHSKPETVLLNDFDHVLSALYAENNDVSIAYRQMCLDELDKQFTPPPAKIDLLKGIWESILPHRELIVLSGNFKTRTKDGIEYSSSEMSDGERVIFYLIAQSLLAKPNTVLIFDEPELHINKSVLAKLWDEIESARPDCSFLYITHDVEFAGSRHAATKYALRSYCKEPKEAWDIELVPENAEIPDDVVATIIGSRRPVLFVEGDGSSLDSSLYRRIYNGFTVIPVGSCLQVIHTVSSFTARTELHRVGCAGLIDADGRTDAEAAYLESKGVYRLPVSEVENLLLLPNVFLAIADAMRFSPEEAETMLATLKSIVMNKAGEEIDPVCLRYTKRRVDAEIKKVNLAGTDIASLESELKKSMLTVEPTQIYNEAKCDFSDAITAGDYEKVLLFYDNKGLLSEAAKLLSYQRKALEEFLGRSLRSDASENIHLALASYLPTVIPRP